MANNYLLEKISSPSDMRALSDSQISELCSEIRNVLISTTSENGGHLASNLGTVELTIAIHKCFNSPDDKIIWDVGHQSYTHKLLTGRYNRFSSLRKEGGISGFTRPDESEHDIFYSGHAGVSVSQASGVDAANRIKGSNGYSVAVIGDGSFTNGMVYEALDASGFEKSNLIVILNDNEMSISPNVGSLARHLAVVRAKPEYYRLKSGTEKALNRIPLVGKSLSGVVFKIKTEIKNILYSSSFFEDLGFRYIGPTDGHSVERLCEAFEMAKRIGKPVLVHVNTVKGYGFAPAETSPEKYHGVSQFDIGGSLPKKSDSFSAQFGRALKEIAAEDDRVCAITAAMSIGTGLEEFAEAFPERFFDAGIAEEHALTFCSGLAAAGMIPVYAVYSSFFQRCFDQLMHDAALQNRKMIIAVDRAGFVGDDGETHQGIYDVSMLSGVPQVTVYSPSCYGELILVLKKAVFDDKGVVVIRYPRGEEQCLPESFVPTCDDYSVIGNVQGKKAVVTYGRVFSSVYKAVSAVDSDVFILKLNKIKPIVDDVYKNLLHCEKIFFFEESVKSGSIGENIAHGLLERGFGGVYRHFAVDDCFVPQASVSRQLEMFGLDVKSISDKLSEL